MRTVFLLVLATLPIPIPVPTPPFVSNEPAVTTSLSDATSEAPEMDAYTPSNPRPLTVMHRTPEGGFYLLPGDYEYVAQSYCLHAGAFGPARGGDGYLYATLKGPRSKNIQLLVERSVSHPEIPQPDIQVLIWGILARAKISDMSLQYQHAASVLLTSQEIFELNGGALGLIPPQAWDRVFANQPPAVRQFLEAEARLRQMLTEAHAPYDELERVAVLTGEPPDATLIRKVPWGRWSRHPNGFFIRYLPSSYSTMRVQIHVPQVHASGSLNWLDQIAARVAPVALAGPAPIQFNPAEGVAVPGNSSRQRLLPSGRPQQGSQPDKNALIAAEANQDIGTCPAKDIPGTDDGKLGCAATVNSVVEEATGSPVGGGLSTADMYQVLKDGAGTPMTKETATPGTIIISPSTEDVHGHVGICLTDGCTSIASNSSNGSTSGCFIKNYTMDSWTKYFEDKKGLDVHFYNVK